MQTLEIHNFLGIKSATLEFRGLNILIGEQASGKSIIARLLYFFNQYFSNFAEFSLPNNEHKSTYDKKRKDKFYEIFPQYSWESYAFEVIFKEEDFEISIRSEKNSSAISLKTSRAVADKFRDLKKEYQKFVHQATGGEAYASTRIFREFRFELERAGLSVFEQPLFVPAARSFYATLRDEIFRVLALDAKIDQIILEFGEFYEDAKLRMDFFQRRSSKHSGALSPTDLGYFDRIVKGRVVRREGRDWITMQRGDIELSRASSGQQEAVPLLVAVSQFPKRGRSLVIEEPEAHLFPSAQREMLEFICRQAVTKRTAITFTTHSPYMLSALNVYLARYGKGLKNSVNPDIVSAYHLSAGTCVSIIDSETKLISAEYLDSISEEIIKDFYEAIEAPDAD